jgi:uncharacterized membrane protein
MGVGPWALAFLAAALATSKDIVSKRLSADIEPNVSAFASFLYPVPLYLLLLAVLYLLGLENFAVGAWFFLYVILRSITDVFAETFKMHALARGELSAVSSIMALYPIILLAFSPLITGDQLTTNILLGVGITVIGNVIMIYQPGVKLGRAAAWYSFGTACFFALNNCFDRLSAQSASAAVSAFAMTAFSCLLLVPLLRYCTRPFQQMSANSKPLWSRGFFEVTFMVTKLLALQHLQGAEVAAVLRSTLVLTVLGGRFVFKETGFTRKLVGSLLMVVGLIVTMADHFS